MRTGKTVMETIEAERQRKFQEWEDTYGQGGQNPYSGRNICRRGGISFPIYRDYRDGKAEDYRLRNIIKIAKGIGIQMEETGLYERR